jgi:hypothetical protein
MFDSRRFEAFVLTECRIFSGEGSCSVNNFKGSSTYLYFSFARAKSMYYLMMGTFYIDAADYLRKLLCLYFKSLFI